MHDEDDKRVNLERGGLMHGQGIIVKDRRLA